MSRGITYAICSCREHEQQQQKHLTPLRRIASDASVGAMSPIDPAFAANVQAQIETPTTPALTPTFTGTTDESDTDFQSAYSASPRQSYAGHEIGEIQDEDEEAETRRLEAEIAASRQARLRRSTNLGSRTNSVDFCE